MLWGSSCRCTISAAWRPASPTTLKDVGLDISQIGSYSPSQKRRSLLEEIPETHFALRGQVGFHLGNNPGGEIRSIPNRTGTPTVMRYICPPSWNAHSRCDTNGAFILATASRIVLSMVGPPIVALVRFMTYLAPVSRRMHSLEAFETSVDSVSCMSNIKPASPADALGQDQ